MITAFWDHSPSASISLGPRVSLSGFFHPCHRSALAGILAVPDRELLNRGLKEESLTARRLISGLNGLSDAIRQGMCEIYDPTTPPGLILCSTGKLKVFHLLDKSHASQFLRYQAIARYCPRMSFTIVRMTNPFDIAMSLVILLLL